MRERSEYENWIAWASIMPTACRYCRRLIDRGRFPWPGEERTPFVPESSCEAFPDGIPYVIYMGEFNHELLYYGDEKVRFLPSPSIVQLDGQWYTLHWHGMPEPI